jgi:hypothetical protein
MSQLPTSTPTARGFSPPIVTQFSIFLDNRVGKLADMTTRLEDSITGRICGLAVHEAMDHAVIRLITNCANSTEHALRDLGLAYSRTEMIVAELSEDQSVSTLCASLLNAEINIHFAYPLLLCRGDNGTLALSVDDPTLAAQILQRKGYRLLAEGDLLDPT